MIGSEEAISNECPELSQATRNDFMKALLVTYLNCKSLAIDNIKRLALAKLVQRSHA
jgi:hypothetical protein